ncbi:hypothetical protein [Cellulosimicrobium sp. TH-20]|uniref:hypothetical protein n=1 Tax=Cellulosimicrobium sp. TH-20 TaxID=1980001 RepID=UPI00119DA6A0|nr:hypothetical protein [Cellulosimicrobium sp. TH-20]
MSAAGILEPEDMPPGELPALTEADVESFTRQLDALDVQPVWLSQDIVASPAGDFMANVELVVAVEATTDGYAVLVYGGGAEVLTPFAATTFVRSWLTQYGLEFPEDDELPEL